MKNNANSPSSSSSSSSNSKIKISILLDRSSLRFYDSLSSRLGVPRSRLISLFLTHFSATLEQDLDPHFSSIVDLLGNSPGKGKGKGI